MNYINKNKFWKEVKKRAKQAYKQGKQTKQNAKDCIEDNIYNVLKDMKRAGEDVTTVEEELNTDEARVAVGEIMV